MTYSATATVDVDYNSPLAQLLAILLISISPCGSASMSPSKANPDRPSQTQYAGMNYFAEAQKRDGPCLYPSPYPDRKVFLANCHMLEENLQRHNICDGSGNGVSHTEVGELKKQLDKFYMEKIEKGRVEGFGHCVCEPNRWPKRDEYCWYKFGFAFLTTLDLPKSELPAIHVDLKICQEVGTGVEPALIPRQKANWTAESVTRYGTQFAQILRLRWNMSTCGDDILLLIVKKRPYQLVNSNGNSKTQGQQFPILFLSFGSEAEKRIEAYDQDDLKDILYVANKRLDQGFALQEVLRRFMDGYKTILNHADMMNFKPKNRNAIPNWAIAIFAVCFGILLCLLLGYALAKSRGRRGPNRNKTTDGGRKWKAGFVGGMFLSRNKKSENSGRDVDNYTSTKNVLFSNDSQYRK